MNDDPFARERFARRQRSPFLGRQAFVPTPEDVVVVKLRWALSLNRSKDVEDARGVIAVQGDRLDWNYIRRWCDAHGTRELLDKVQASTATARQRGRKGGQARLLTNGDGCGSL
jgi:hypothetical protein